MPKRTMLILMVCFGLILGMFLPALLFAEGDIYTAVEKYAEEFFDEDADFRFEKNSGGGNGIFTITNELMPDTYYYYDEESGVYHSRQVISDDSNFDEMTANGDRKSVV